MGGVWKNTMAGAWAAFGKIPWRAHGRRLEKYHVGATGRSPARPQKNHKNTTEVEMPNLGDAQIGHLYKRLE